MSYADIEIKIIQWAEARKIIPNSNPESQLLKAVSEIGELADATIKKDREAILDSVGDVMVCLINSIWLVRCFGGFHVSIDLLCLTARNTWIAGFVRNDRVN